MHSLTDHILIEDVI